MILHRRIHKFVHGQFDTGVGLAKDLDRLARQHLASRSRLYVSSAWGGQQPRPRLIVDTEHDSLSAMEDYFERFKALPEVALLLPKWCAVEEETWAETYVLVPD